MRSKTTRGEGLVPRWGRGGAWQNPPRELAVSNRRAKPQHRLSKPWCAGESRHERLVRECALQSTSMPTLHQRILPSRRPMVDRGMRKCSAVEDYARRGACPPLGRRRGVTQSAAPIRRTKPYSSFSYLGVPVATGMSDWYENDVTRPRVSLNATAPALVVPAPQFVIPAKAGIHALTSRERTPTAIPPPTSTRRPRFVFPAKTVPNPDTGRESRGGGGAAQMTPERFQAPGTHFHTLVCRRPPASATAMKACPGLRPRIDSRHSFVIPAKAGIQKRWGGVREATHHDRAAMRRSKYRVLLPRSM